MQTPQSPALKRAMEDIAWILNNPATSPWLRRAIVGATQNDPISVLNDLEILKDVLVRWANANIETTTE
ncbi:hypothetical protein [Bradyrhizobium sp. BR13661]|jgi:hypothetical protein|uniref:hypothetical protein n=1 Tax=Bradyrhizobium sp. BR13661 TaxID=2940622 RepID=UPI0024731647|nr:hypothetical protein [Bradyrhizobium sp. BR13661]MDH6257548.1 hypothetical protein [Bradyrhizobium sp. BR13661]